MAYNPNFKPILLTKEQMEVIKRIQDGERSKSPLNVAPTLNAFARGLMEKILKQEGYV